MMFVLGPLLHNVAAMSGGGGAPFSPTTLPGIIWDLENIPASVINTGTTPATDLQTVVKWNSQTGGLNVNDNANGTTFQPVWHANSGANGWLHFANAGLESTVAFGGTDASGSYYLAAMVNFDSVAANKNAIQLWDNGSGTIVGEIRVLAGGAIQGVASDNAFGLHSASGATITASTWHTIIMSVDGTAGTIDVWVDGTLGTQFTGLTPLVRTTNSKLYTPDSSFADAFSLKAALHGTGTISSGNAASLNTYLTAL